MFTTPVAPMRWPFAFGPPLVLHAKARTGLPERHTSRHRGSRLDHILALRTRQVRNTR